MASFSLWAYYNAAMELAFDPQQLQRARLARDARFDGLFFVAVLTTGIYCRPICPATPPKEANVRYYPTAVQAGNAGFRPCLRCRPDSAPRSNAWLGVETSVRRALNLIHEGVLEERSLPDLAGRLGISDRYLRQLFQKHLGLSPKAYALYQQCLFAKSLLHQTRLPITQIALASGFSSLRRFNDCFKQKLGLTPSQVCKENTELLPKNLTLRLSYRPPFCWEYMYRFLSQRAIAGMESCENGRYSRTFAVQNRVGRFSVRPLSAHHQLEVKLETAQAENLHLIINKIRHLFDLDTNIGEIESQLASLCDQRFYLQAGLRIPGIWSLYEAGIRAILGQQVSVKQAIALTTLFVQHLGARLADNSYLFPTPAAVLDSNLSFLKIPGARKDTLRALSAFVLENEGAEHLEKWRSIKGIGDWTIGYVRLRGLSEPDIWLASDAAVRQVGKRLPSAPKPKDAAPWRSYLTLHYWNQPL